MAITNGHAARAAAYCTLVTNDDYVTAALVLAKSLRDVEVRHLLAILVTPDTVSKASMSQLQSLYDEIIPVAPISGVSTDNLSIIGRPDLHATLTKLQLWALTQFSRVLYLDADTLVLKNLDHLFDFLPPSVEFAASPELGFPDCFNAGLMFLTPREGTYAELRQFAELHESFDGGDQGILNAFFGDGSFGHPCKELLVGDRQKNRIENGDGQAVKARPNRNWYRLSFTYNMEMHKVYRCYVPAILRYKDEHKVLHFIGKDKPWHFTAGQVEAPEDASAYFKFYSEMVGKWWDVQRSLGPVALE